VLRELNNIASDLLGLHGYPLQPIAWGGIFDKRARPDAADTLARRSTNVPAQGAGKPLGAASPRWATRSHA